jgi:hypothetical protein
VKEQIKALLRETDELLMVLVIVAFMIYAFATVRSW